MGSWVRVLIFVASVLPLLVESEVRKYNFDVSINLDNPLFRMSYNTWIILWFFFNKNLTWMMNGCNLHYCICMQRSYIWCSEFKHMHTFQLLKLWLVNNIWRWWWGTPTGCVLASQLWQWTTAFQALLSLPEKATQFSSMLLIMSSTMFPSIGKFLYLIYKLHNHYNTNSPKTLRTLLHEQ